MKSINLQIVIILLFASGTFFTSCKKKELPTLTTLSVTQITTNSGKSGGDVSDDGNLEVISRGLVWGTSQSPTLQSNIGLLSSGSGLGTFAGDLTGLLSGTNYFVRAYATNSEGTGYGNEVQFTTNQVVLATITTTAISTITANSAVSGGNIASDGGGSILAKGVCWSTSSNPTTSDNKTTDGAGTGSFNSSIIGLAPNTTYYVKAYVTNTAGTAYGEELSFTTKYESCIPVLVSPTNNVVMDNSCNNGGTDNTVWTFDWNDCNGATKYNISVIAPGASTPAIDFETTNSNYARTESSGFVPDANRLGWTWRVRAFINGEWGAWSEERTFDVEPVNTDCSGQASGYRIVSEEWLLNGQWRMTLNYEYSGEQISKLTQSNVEGELFEVSLQYPDNNTIIIDYPSGESDWKIGFYENKVKEIIVENTGYAEKSVFDYNLDGQVQTIKLYDSPPNWIFYGEETYTYDLGKLMQFASYPDPAEHRYVYSYNGDFLNNCVYSYRESGGSWTVYSTAVYTYTNGKMSKITRSDGLSTEYSYDSFGNLIEKNKYYQSYHDQIIYTYEKGIGNYRKICEFFNPVSPDWDLNEYREPQPK